MKKVKVLSFINLLLFLAMITVNALANILPINGYNTGELSDRIPNLFVPAGITFSIWSVIYLLLLSLMISDIMEAFREKETPSASYYYTLLLNFLLNMAWIIAWHYLQILISLIIMLGIFATLLLLNRQFINNPIRNWAINIYFGWISVATIANVTALLVTWGWRGAPLSQSTWTIIIILVGAIIASLIVIRERNYPYMLVFLWAYAGIWIKRSIVLPREQSIIVTVFIAMALILLSGGYGLLKKKKSQE